MPELAAKSPSAGRIRMKLLASAAGMVLAIALTAPQACALPTQSGALTGATVQTASTTETVTVSQSRAYAEWSSFNVNSGETFQVSGQTGKNWILVNKVTAGTGSIISGNVSANGQVWIIDPNGVTVNAGAAINVGGLLLSSAAWSSTDTTNFLAGGTTWSLTGASGPIVMNGTINAAGGVVVLHAPSVTVGGTMTDAANSQFLAVAAKDISLTFGDNGTYFTLDGVTIQRGSNGGKVQFASGASISADRIILAAAGETSAADIVVAGGVSATKARGDGTDIVLTAADGTGPDATPTAQAILSGGAVPSWSAGAAGSQGTVGLSSGGSLSAAGVSIAAGGDITLASGVTATSQASLYSSTGNVTQTAGVISTPTLTGSAGASLSLPDANLVGALSSFSAGSGVSVANAQNLSVSGVNGGTGAVTLSTPSHSILINGDITAGGAITFDEAAQLGADATLTGSLAKFSSTLSGAHALTITGAAEFDGAVGAGANLTSLSVSGATTLDGGAVTTTGTQGYAGAVTLGVSDATLKGSLVKFGSTVDGARGLTITGDGEFHGAVGGTTPLTSMSVSGATALAGASVKTTGTQTYTGAVTLSKDVVTLNGSAVSFGGTVDGPTNLTVDTAGTTTFTGAVGGTAALASLTTEGGGPIDVNGGVVKTTGAQSFDAAVTLGADATFNSTGGQAIGFNSTVDGGFKLTAYTSGTTTFTGAVGGAAALAALTTGGGGVVDVNGAVVKTTGAQSFGGAVVLGADTTFSSTGGQAVGFGSTLDGGFNLVVDTAGTTTFGGAVGGTAALTSVTTEGAGAVDLNGGQVKTSGAQSFGGAVMLGADATLFSTGGRAVGFGSTVDGGFNLTVDTAGTTTFTGAVGGTAALASVTTQGGGPIDVNGGLVKTTGAQSFDAAVTLGADATFSSTSGGNIGFNATVDGGFNLAADTSGTTTFKAAVGGTAALAAVTTQGGGAVEVDGGLVKTSGAQSFGGPVTLGADTTFFSTGGQAVGFGSTLDGAFNLTVDTAGTTTFGGAVGGTAALASVTTQGGGPIDVNGGLVKTSGAQSFDAAVTLGAGATFESTGGQAVGFGSTVDGGFNLTIDTAGTTTFASAVGGTAALASATTEGGGAVEVNGGLVKTIGAQSFGGPVALGTDATFQSTGGQAIGFGSTVDGGFNLTIDTAGAATFGGAVGGGAALSSLTTQSGGTVEVDGGLVKTTGAQSFGGPIALGADASFESTGGQGVSFGAMNGPFNLTVDTSGTTTFGGAVGGSTALASVTTQGGGSIEVSGAGITTTGAQSFDAPVTLAADATFKSTGGQAIGFSSTVDGGFNLTVDTAGTTTFARAVGGTTALASVTVGGGGSVEVNGGGVTTTGAQSFNDALTLGTDTTFRSTGGQAIGFAAVDGAYNLTVDTSGTSSFGGAVGANAALTSVTTVGGGAVNVSGGGVTTTGAQSFGGPVTLGADATFHSTGGQAIGFGAVDGPSGLTVDTAGMTTFAGAVGGTVALASLTTQGGGSVEVNGGAVTTTGGQSFGGPVTLGADATFESTGGQAIGFNSTLDGGFNLTVDTAGTTTFAHAVGGTAALASVTTGAGGAVDMNGGAVTTTGAQSFGGSMRLGADTIFHSTGGQAIGLGAVDGAYNLTVDTSGTATFAGGVGGNTALASVTTQGGAAVHLNGGLVKTTGLQTLAGPVTLGADATLISAGGAVDFGAAVDGAFNLAVNTSGATTFASSVGAVATLAGLQVSAGSISLSGAVQTSGALSLTSGAGLAITTRLTSNGGNVTLAANGGDLALGTDVDAGAGTLTLFASRAVAQNGGKLTAGVLTGSAGTSAALGDSNAVASVSSFSATTGFSFVNGAGFSAAGVAGGTSTSLKASTGDLTLAGNIGGTTTTLTATTGAIDQTGGEITATTLTGSAGTSASFGGANAVGTLSGFWTTQGLTFVNGAGFTATGVDGGTAASLTASTGDLTLAGNISGATTTLTATTGGVSQSGGVITAGTLSGSAGTNVRLNEANAVGALSGFIAGTGLSFVNGAGFSAQGVDGGTATNLAASMGDLTLAGNVSGQTTTLTAGGAISQTGGIVTAGVLTGSAGTRASLMDANAVGTLSGFTAPGGLVFVNGAGFTAQGVDGGASTSLTANSGDLTLAGNVSGATTTTLSALTGSILQTGGIVTAATLVGSAAAGASLTQANAVQTLSGFTAGTGLAFTDAGGFTAANVEGGASISLTAAGQLTLAGDIGGTSVALTANGGPIVQTAGTLTAGTLTGSSLGATTLTAANRVGGLGAFTTYGPGADFTLVNAQTLTVTGPLTAGATASGAAAATAGGSIALTTTAGQLNLDGNLIANSDASGAGGAVTLTSAGGIASGDPPGIQAQDISISNQFGSVWLGDLTATRDIAVTTTTGSVTIDSASAGGNIVLRAPGDIAVVGGLSATGATSGAGAGQALFASDPTTLAGVAFNLAGSNVDLKAGGTISVGGTITAATDARLQAGSSITVADVSAGRDIFLDAAGAPPPLIGPIDGASMQGGEASANGQATVSTGALTAAGRDIAVLAETGDAVIGAASAGDDVAIRAAGNVTVTGGLTAGAAGGADASGVADQLIAASTTAPIASVGTVYSSLAQSADVDVKAGWTLAGVQSAGASITVGGATSAGGDARFQAVAAIGLNAVTAGQDVVADGAGITAGPTSAGRDASFQASGAIGLGAVTAGQDVVADGAAVTAGSTSAGRDARFQATGAIDLAAVTAGQDVVADGANVTVGALSATNGDVALQASGAVQIASASAGDAIVISSGGATSVSGALTAVGAGTGDSRTRAGDSLADAVLGLQPGPLGGDVVIAATSVQLGSVSAANGDVLMFARPSGGTAGVTYLGGTASSSAQGGFHLDQPQIGVISARSLDIFAGLSAGASGNVSIGALKLSQSLPTVRVYTGGATSRVDVFGPVTGAAGSSLVIGDTQLRSALNAPSAAVSALAQGWTPNVIRVEGTIGGLGAGQAFNQVSLSAQSIYIAPVEAGLDFETAVQTTRPEALPVYIGSMTYQIAAAHLQLSAAGPGVIYERNLATNPADLADGVGLSVGKLTIATPSSSNAPPSQIALFGTLSPQGTVLNAAAAALSLTYLSQSGPAAPVLFNPPAATAALYKFSNCAFGGGACFVTVPPVNVNPVPVPSLIGDVSDPYAPIDEEPVTSSGGEIAWPTSSGRREH